MTRVTALLVFVALAAAGPASGARRAKRKNLLLVASPTSVGAVSAHPFVNAKVYFGNVSNGPGVDPRTFSARLGRHDVTSLFVDFTDNGGIGKRAVLEAGLVRTGPHVNRLRVAIRSVPFGPHHKRLRDVHTVRFRAVEVNDHAPTAVVTATTDVILPGVPVRFTGTGSFDPDHDWLTYDWDFGDGSGHSTDPSPTHVFADGTTDLDVSLTVSDSQLTGVARTRLLAAPSVDPGRTPGILRLDAARTLELGAVPLGATGTATFTVTNPDTTPTSQLRVRLGTDAAAFTVTPPTLDLGAGQHADVTLTFAPTAPGHQQTFVTAVASSTNRRAIHALGHGFGGAAPGTGPTLAGDVVFGNIFLSGTFAILPSGQRVSVDNSVGVCSKADHTGTQDLCVTSVDCATAGESCNAAASTLFDPINLCGDGQGNLYLLSDTGTYTDPGGDTSKTESVLHIAVNASGNRTGADMFARTEDNTANIACDRRAAGAVYLARAMDLSSSSCFRDSEEDLLALSKPTGKASVLYGTIDQAEGEDLCNGDFDPTGDVEATRDGTSIFVSFQSNGGIYRIVGPSPTPLEIEPDIPDVFQVHPDGAILYAQTNDPGANGVMRGTTGTITLYKMFPQQSVSAGPLPLSQRTPCAVFTLPDNQGVTGLGSISIAAGRVASGSNDAVVLVSFGVTEGPPPHPGAPLVLGRNMRVQGTVVFSSPAGDAPCSVVGVMNVEQIDPLRF